MQEPLGSAGHTIARDNRCCTGLSTVSRLVGRSRAEKRDSCMNRRILIRLKHFLFPHALDDSPVWAPTLRTVDTRARIISNHILNTRRPGNAPNANTCSCPRCHQRCWGLSRAPHVCSAPEKPASAFGPSLSLERDRWLSRPTAEASSHRES